MELDMELASCVDIIAGPCYNIDASRDEEDKCSVCLELPTEPRVLPCCHTFCTKCLKELVGEFPLGTFDCPNCRAKTDVPLEGVDGFPLDYAAQKSEEFRSFNAEAETEAPCKSCEDPDTADVEPAAYCPDCGGGICKGCVQQHHRMKRLRDHDMVDWHEFCQDTFKPKRSHQQCRNHQGMEVQLFCEPCKQFVCCVCLQERHRTHIDSAKRLEEVSKDKTEKVSRLKEEAGKMLTESERRLEGLKEMEKGLAGYPNDLEKSIINAFEEYMRLLKLWQQQQLTEAQERCSEIAKGIEAQQTDAINVLESLKAGIQFAKKAVSCTTDHEIIEMSNIAINQLEYTMKACDRSPFKRPLVFEKGNLHFGRLRDIEPGDIKVDVPQFCFMDIENPVQVSFTLPVNTLPSLKIMYGSQKQRSVTASPTGPADTKCEVGFVPRCAGKHSIEVYIGGVMCKRCDDVMVVRGAPKQESRVRPGPDWKDEENNGVTSGTVLNVEQLPAAGQLAAPGACIAMDQFDEEQESFKVTVQWDNGNVVKYNWGNNDEYQLELDE